jgi:hypothetical protein
MAATIPTNGLGLASGLAITDGDLTFASGHGISFAATSDAGGMASELLDDYEEGTFTPTIQTSVNTASTSTAVAGYTKVGDTVYVSGYIVASDATSFDGVTSRTIRLGLPFTSSSTSNFYQGSINIPYYGNLTLDSGHTGMGGYVTPNEALVRLTFNGQNSIQSLTEEDLTNNGTYFMFGGSYKI